VIVNLIYQLQFQNICDSVSRDFSNYMRERFRRINEFVFPFKINKPEQELKIDENYLYKILSVEEKKFD